MMKRGWVYPVLVIIAAAVIGVIAGLSLQSGGIGFSQTPRTTQAVANTLSEEEMAELERAIDLQQDAYSAAYNAEFAALEAKESTVRAIVYADQRIQDHIAGAYGYQSDLIRANLASNGTDVLLIYVVGKRLPIEGDWKTGYTKTYTGIFELKVSVKGSQVVSIEKIPKDDVTNVKTFSDSEKNALEKAFANPAVAAAVEGKDVMVVGMMPLSSPDCPRGSCVFIFLEQPAKRQFLSLIFNTSTSEVLELNKGEGW